MSFVDDAQVNTVAVPEPRTDALIILGGLLLLGHLGRKKITDGAPA
jgi:hypothetical protein